MHTVQIHGDRSTLGHLYTALDEI
eukprot:COSAG02_NODE_55896_length_288_cov_0.788360_1_plen_23_part_01